MVRLRCGRTLNIYATLASIVIEPCRQRCLYEFTPVADDDWARLAEEDEEPSDDDDDDKQLAGQSRPQS